MAPDDEQPTEPNSFLHTLIASKGTVERCAETVHATSGSPLDAVADPLGSGGWSCAEADDWIAELVDRCSGIAEAFDDAVSTIGHRIGAEPDRVPQDDWRGHRWNRDWAIR